MSEQNKQMVRSILASIVGIAGSILVIAGVIQASDVAVDLPSWWVQGLVYVTLVSTVARTLIAYVDSGNTSFGRGSA